MTESIAFLSQTRPNCELSACGLTLNISRQRLTCVQYENLLQKAKDCGLIDKQRQMMDGEVVNASEKDRPYIPLYVLKISIVRTTKRLIKPGRECTLWLGQFVKGSGLEQAERKLPM